MIANDRDVEYALRNLHSGRLGESHVAEHLRRIFGTGSLTSAIAYAVEGAFRDAGEADYAELRDLIFAADIENWVPREEAARNFGVSPRTYYRKRKKAIRIIVDHVNKVLSGGDDVTLLLSTYLKNNHGQRRDSPVAACADEIVESAWRRAREQFRTAWLLGELEGMQRCISSLNGYRKRLSQDHSLELLAMDAEISVYRGEFFKASRALNTVFSGLDGYSADKLWLLALFVRAELAFCAGSFFDAMTISRTVKEFATNWLRFAAESLEARAAIAAGSFWRDDAVEPVSEWDALTLEVIRSRQALNQGAYVAAQQLAVRAKERSLVCGFLPHASYAAATLAGVYGATSDRRRSVETLDALKLLAASGSNAVLARDLFQFGPGVPALPSNWLDEGHAHDLARIYLSMTPSSLFADRSFRGIVSELVRAILLGIDSDGKSHRHRQLLDDLSQSQEAMNVVGDLPDEIERLAAFGNFLKVLAPIKNQPSFAREFTRSSGVAIRTIARSRSLNNLRALAVVS